MTTFLQNPLIKLDSLQYYHFLNNCLWIKLKKKENNEYNESLLDNDLEKNANKVK